MALQLPELPEPAYYTLAEVSERWGVSQDYLLRIADEDNIKLAIKLPPCIMVELEHADFPAPKTREDFEGLFPGYAEKFRYGTINGKTQIEQHLKRPSGENEWRIFYPDDEEATLEEHLLEQEWWTLFYIEAFGYGIISTPFLLDRGIDGNTIDHVAFSSVTHFISGEPWPIQGTPCPFPPISESGWVFNSKIDQVAISELLVPTTEIHRIEHKQEKVDQAIAKAEAESPIPSQSRRALNTRAKVIGALVKSHNINLADKGATSALNKKLELQGVALDRDTVKTILDEAREQIEKPN